MNGHDHDNRSMRRLKSSPDGAILLDRATLLARDLKLAQREAEIAVAQATVAIRLYRRVEAERAILLAPIPRHRALVVRGPLFSYAIEADGHESKRDYRGRDYNFPS